MREQADCERVLLIVLSAGTNGTNGIFCFILCWEKVLPGAGLWGSALWCAVMAGQDPGHSAVPVEM